MSKMQRGGEIVNNTSNGILLHGLIHIRNEEAETYCVVAQDKLLDNVSDGQVDVSLLNIENKVDETFFTQTESRRFQEHVNKTRNVIGGSIGLNVVGFGGLEIGLKQVMEETSREQQKTKASANYLSRNHILIRRKLSLQLRKDGQFHFAKDVYTSLNDIVKTSKRKEEYEKCKAFFIKYGSHVDLGKCCLGGVADIVSECKGVQTKFANSNDDEKFTEGLLDGVVGGVADTESDCKEVHKTFAISSNDEKITEDLIDGVVKGVYDFVAGKVKITADDLMIKQKQLVEKDSMESRNYELRANIYGGNSTASLQEWEKSLTEETTNLHIIDRGCLKYMFDNGIATEHQDPSNNYRGVWELLREQQGKVTSLETFNFVEAARKTEVFYNTFLYRERIIEITQGIGKEPRAVEYFIALKKIFKVNKWRKNEVKNLDEWGQFIEDDDTFINFVKKMDSLSDLHSDLFIKIKDTFRALMEQVEKEHENIQRVLDVKVMIDSKVKLFTPEILKNRDQIETTIAVNMYTEDGVAYSKALKTILKDVNAIKQKENDSYWISMLRKKSVYRFLLKPKKYMVMTMQTFDEVRGTLKELTQEPARVAALPKNQEITDLVFNKDRELIEKIQFRARVRRCVDPARNIRTAEEYKQALEEIQSAVYTILHTPAARSEALTELMKEDKSIAAFLQKAVSMKTSKKILSDIGEIVFELFAYVDFIDYPKKSDIEADIVKKIEEPDGMCTLV